MCGIIVAPKEKIYNILKEQDNRGLDSIGIINKNFYYKAVKRDLGGYKKFIKEQVDFLGGLHIVHHRKATIGEININNAHPFIGEKFILVQNGTAKDFHKEVSDLYDKDVDSHNLLLFIEEHTDNIYQIPEVMDLFYEIYKEDFGILIIGDKKGNIIFISDGARESFIKVKNNKIKLIKNYRDGKMEGYKNIGYIIFNYEGEIFEMNFKEELNSKDFKEKYLYYQKYNEEKQKKEEEDVEDLVDGYYRREIKNYLWGKYDILTKFAVHSMKFEFLKDIYQVDDMYTFRVNYGETFPHKIFEEEYEKILKVLS